MAFKTFIVARLFWLVASTVLALHLPHSASLIPQANEIPTRSVSDSQPILSSRDYTPSAPLTCLPYWCYNGYAANSTSLVCVADRGDPAGPATQGCQVYDGNGDPYVLPTSVGVRACRNETADPTYPITEQCVDPPLMPYDQVYLDKLGCLSTMCASLDLDRRAVWCMVWAGRSAGGMVWKRVPMECAPQAA